MLAEDYDRSIVDAHQGLYRAFIYSWLPAFHNSPLEQAAVLIRLLYLRVSNAASHELLGHTPRFFHNLCPAVTAAPPHAHTDL